MLAGQRMLTDLRRKKCLIIELVLDPSHEVINILGSRTFDWLLDVGSISPMILIPLQSTNRFILVTQQPPDPE